MDGPAYPSAPRSLADPSLLAARRALLATDAAHLRPLQPLLGRIRAERGIVPDPDPLDGGADARLLVLLETPGPHMRRTGFVSRDNPAGTAANLFRFLHEAGILRCDTLIWNAVPFLIHEAGAGNRAPTRTEARDGLRYLPPLLDLLPRLKVVVCAGRFAQGAAPTLRAHRPALRIVAVPHPSPTYVCTSPLVRERILAGLHEARLLLAEAL